MERTGFSVVLPTFNEAPGIAATMNELTLHVGSLRSRYDIELLVVDDGSSDATVTILRQFSQENPETIRIVEHAENAGLVAAMRTGAEASRYPTVVFLDADLSYRPDVIEPLVLAREEAGAAAALASPYMAGGRVANVPFVRLVASRGANWILARCASGRLRTFTGMVRAYDRATFLDLFTQPQVGEFNAWAVAMLLRAGKRVVEIPADLVWPSARVEAPSRLSAGKLWQRTYLVFETAGVLMQALRSSDQNGVTGPLVLAPRSTGPYTADS